jgi:creatinine amidohydrolase/Fe(II)-dependent formamide hydrolase-like protein
MLAPPPRVSTSYNMKEISESGIVGYSTHATKKKGKLIVEAVLERLVNFINEIARM